MKFSYNWICELVDGLDLAPKDLEKLITMKTAECEGIADYEAFVAMHIRRGRSIFGLFPATPESTAEYQIWVKAGRRTLD